MTGYFRYFSIVVILLAALLAFLAGNRLQEYIANEMIRQPISQQSSHIASQYLQEIWCRYVPFIQNEMSQSVQWRESRFFDNFHRVTQSRLSSFPATKIALYGADGKILYQSNPLELVFFESAVQDPIDVAVDPSRVSRLIQSMGYYDTQQQLIKGAFIQEMIPIDAAQCPQNATTQSTVEVPPALMVFYHDVTISWQRLMQIRWIMIAAILMFCAVCYLFILIQSRRAQAIIQKQHEENLELSDAKAQAESQSKEKSMFLANVSHELRTPLNAVIGFSEIIKDELLGPLGDPQYKEYMNDIHGSGVHLLSLINDILDYSKAEAKKLDVETMDVDVTKLSQSCLRMVEPRAREGSVKMVMQAPSDKHIILTADPKRLKQVLLNLLSNAVKFTPEGGTVTLSLKEEPVENRVVITVKDTGIGISAKNISKALAPFGQVDSALSRRYEGTGLGLPLTKKLTEIMDGTFDIKSEEGLGTTVTLIYPMTKHVKETSPREF